jgi:DNA (cytosine-5)-methyltransferase 1
MGEKCGLISHAQCLEMTLILKEKGEEKNVDSTQNIISFCTGYGGIELGLRRAGVDVRVVCNVEIEAFVQANLVAKIEEGLMDDAPIYTDLKTFPAEIFRGKICGIIGGYPCQPFSSAGKRKGEKDPRHLWPYIRSHVRAVRPLWCFFENVRGHTTMGLWRVLSDLEEDGYRTEWGLYSAEETGAPHQRIRCFILAHTASREPRQSQARNGGQDTSGGSEEELVYSRLLGSKECKEQTARIEQSSEDTRWPARPGEEQYEWEEPRVTEAQSELGGAVDGLTHRVDRLRLLGNGVVPQTAELAWKSLWRKINEQL